ncbi:MAG: flagellar hook-basal body complex protein [Alphaproteobacteria bacterium]|nr:flagellar hook-basal body complex protein [Alphaproteobacteria bacterium]
MSLRSVHIASQALRAQSTRFSSISENIANINTTGYKRSTVHFSEMVGGSTNMANTGARNGGTDLGSSTHAGIFGGITSRATRNFLGDGRFQKTNGELDLAIQGSGQFIVRGYTGDDFSVLGEAYLTSAGNFQLRPYYKGGVRILANQGVYLSDQNGYNVMGWLYDETTATYATGSSLDSLSPIRVKKSASNEVAVAIATSSLTFNGNLTSDTPVGNTVSLSFNLYTGNGKVDATGDELDTSIVDAIPMNFKFKKIDGNLWEVMVVNLQFVEGKKADALTDSEIPNSKTIPAALLETEAQQHATGWRVQFDDEGKPLRAWKGGGKFPSATAAVVTDFTNFNEIFTVTAPSFEKLMPDPNNPGQMIQGPTAPTKDLKVSFDIRNLTSFGGESTVTLTPNGRPVGVRQFKKMGVEADGIVYRYFDDNSKMPLAKLVAGVVRGVNNLSSASGALFSINSNSGELSILSLGAGGSQKLLVGMLEFSDVDLVESFSSMIVNQRSYSLNAKTLTTAIEMEQRATELKK